MGKVEENHCLREILKKIEVKRECLNRLVAEDSKKDEVLNLSMELDKLIVKYYDAK